MPERVLSLSKSVSVLATKKVAEIQKITGMSRILALNAMIEAARAGEFGKGFAVVAQEVRVISDQIAQISKELNNEMLVLLSDLTNLGQSLVGHIRGTRLADLALSSIDIIDRNLYERSCDVRWWATDSAVVNCLAEPTPEHCAFASKRMGVILGAYTVYLDLWIADVNGKVISNGRPERYPDAKHANVSGEAWFRQALRTASGEEFAVTDVAAVPALQNKLVATYAAAVREGGDANGKVLGVLGIYFDWQAQSQAIVNSIRLADDEKDRTRALILDNQFRVIAASDGKGVLSEIFPLETGGKPTGNYVDKQGRTIGFALTPGYETYRGLGWYGCIVQEPVKTETA
jgi:hypothetical protein